MTVDDLDRNYEPDMPDDDPLADDLPVALQLLNDCADILAQISRLNRNKHFLTTDQWREVTNVLTDVSMFVDQFEDPEE